MPRVYHPYFEFMSDLKTLNHDRVTEDEFKLISDAKERIVLTGQKTAAAAFVLSGFTFKCMKHTRPLIPALIVGGLVGAYGADRAFRKEYVAVKEALPKESYLGNYINDIIQPYYNYYYGNFGNSCNLLSYFTGKNSQ